MIVRSIGGVLKSAAVMFGYRGDSASYLPKYCERPYTAAQFLSMSMEYIRGQQRSCSLWSLLHGIYLMQKGVTVFSYDLYRWTCSRLIEYQSELSKQQMLMMLRLAAEYKIREELFLKHIENELHLRIHRDYHQALLEYDTQIQQQLRTLYDKLEANSKDYFKMLNQEEEEQEQQEDRQHQQDLKEQQQERTQILINEDQKWAAQMSQRILKKTKGNKEITFSDLLEISSILRLNGSKNLALIQYLLQLLTVQFQQGQLSTAASTLTYLQLTTLSCQNLMQQYRKNKHLYTARSVKRIFKYQFFYYIQHQRQLEQNVAAITDAQLQQLVETYGLFPIRRREVRRNIGKVLAGEISKRGIESRRSLALKLVEINAKDEKMKRLYRDLLGLPQPQPQNTQSSQIENQSVPSAEQQTVV